MGLNKGLIFLHRMVVVSYFQIYNSIFHNFLLFKIFDDFLNFCGKKSDKQVLETFEPITGYHGYISSNSCFGV